MNKDMDTNAEPVADIKQRKPRRTKADLEKAIRNAAENLIKNNGFSDTLVTDIMKEAEIEPVVFYNRYKNIDEFYEEFVKSCDYWFSDVMEESSQGENLLDDLYNMMCSLLSELSGKSVMLELLRWEIAQGNSITNATAQLREKSTLPLAGKYLNHYFGADVDIIAWASILISGIYYLCLHKDRSEFCGIDVGKPEHVERLKKTLRCIIDQLRYLLEKRTEKQRFAYNLQQHGVSKEIIQKCLEL